MSVVRLELLIAVICTLLVVSCGKKREVSDEECQAMEAIFDEAATLAEEKQAALSSALEAAMAQPLAVSDAACSVPWTYRYETIVVKADEVSEAAGDSIRNARGMAESASYMVPDCPIGLQISYQADMEELQTRIEEIRGGYDMVVVETNRVDAVVDEATSTYVPGSLQGRAFVFNYETSSIVCAADLEVSNSDVVDVSANSQARWELAEDLDRRIGAAARDNLRASAATP